jgi:hypothetical protein
VIWVDITNAPHVLFFQDFIRRNRVFVTARRHAGLTGLLKARGIGYTLVGKHGGREAGEKLLQSARRVAGLSKHVSRLKVELGVSKQSVELPRVAFGLGMPCLQVVDNEYAEHQNRLTLALCTRILVPKALDVKRLLEQGAEKERITRFNGLCELAHLRNFKPAERAVKEEYILVRPEPLLAAYFTQPGKTQRLIDALAETGYKVLVLPRAGERYRRASTPRTLDSLSLIYHAAAFVGGGGTMNRESALLGTPAISYYPQEPLGVDRFLMRRKLLVHAEPEDIPSLIEEITGEKQRLRRRAERLRRALEDPVEVLEREVSSLRARSS